jgi:uncharacterized protein (TIGR00730 family)
MSRICVFCGSSPGVRASYGTAAATLGTELVRRGLGLVYGGGSVGLMGVLADAVLAAGGEAIGVIPRGLASRELAHAGLTELRLVQSMHERKATMASLVDAFVALPGGLGTLDELFEALTLIQTGKIAGFPVVLLGRAYWRPLTELLAALAADGAIDQADLRLFLATDDLDEMARHLERHAIGQFGLRARREPQPFGWLGERQLARRAVPARAGTASRSPG